MGIAPKGQESGTKPHGGSGRPTAKALCGSGIAQCNHHVAGRLYRMTEMPQGISVVGFETGIRLVS